MAEFKGSYINGSQGFFNLVLHSSGIRLWGFKYDHSTKLYSGVVGIRDAFNFELASFGGLDFSSHYSSKKNGHGNTYVFNQKLASFVPEELLELVDLADNKDIENLMGLERMLSSNDMKNILAIITSLDDQNFLERRMIGKINH